MKYISPLVCLIVVFLMNVTASAGETTVRLTNGEWPPYMSRELPDYGIGSRIVTEAFGIEGIKTGYEFLPRKRAFYEADKGRDYNGSILWFSTPERQKNFYISDPVLDSKVVFFHLKEKHFEWNSVDDLKKYFIGGTLEYDYGPEFGMAEKKGIITVERVPSDEQNFAKLIYGRIDIFPLDIDAGLAIIKKMKPEDAARITFNPRPLKEAPLCLILTKNMDSNRMLLEQFNRGLGRIRSSGLYDRIIQGYLIEKTVVAASRNVSNDWISGDELRSMFLGRTTRWNDGRRVSLVLIKKDKNTDAFMKYHFGRTFSQLRDYWEHNLYAGKGQMPPVFESVSEAAAFISENDGAVGFLPNDFPAGNLKILEVR